MRPLHPDSKYMRMCCRRSTLQSIPGHLNWHLTSHRYTAALQSAQIPHPWPNCNVKLRDRNQSYFCSNWKKFFLFACFPAQECWWLRGGGWTSTPEGGGDVTWPLLAPAPGAIGLYFMLCIRRSLFGSLGVLLDIWHFHAVWEEGPPGQLRRQLSRVGL